MTAAMSHNSKKSSWPELEGLPSDVAKHKILADRPDVEVDVLPYGSFVTQEYNDKRVRVYFNYFGNVAGVPKIG
jgi:hypothetical protein